MAETRPWDGSDPNPKKNQKISPSVKTAAKKKFGKYPSLVANMWAAKQMKKKKGK